MSHQELPDAGLTAHQTIDLQLPSAGQKAALAGTPGTPGPAERFLTESHAADADAHHAPVSVADTDTVDLTLSGQQVSAALRRKAGGHLAEDAGGLSVDEASEAQKGVVELADDSAVETTPGLALQASDAPATPAASRIVRLDGDGHLHLPSGSDVTIGAMKGLLAALQALAIYGCSGALTLTTSQQAISGCATGNFTPDADETAIIVINGVVDQAAGTGACNGADQLTFRAYENYAGAAITSAIFLATGAVGVCVGLKWYALALTAGTTYNITLQCRNASGARGQVATTTQLVVWRVPR